MDLSISCFEAWDLEKAKKMTFIEFAKYADYKIGLVASTTTINKAQRQKMILTALDLNNNEADKANKKILPSLKNHFEKLIEDLNNPQYSCKIKLNRSETLTPYEVNDEITKALISFIEIASKRNGDGIRNAYVSFARARRQKYIRNKSENNDGDGRRGRPNLYTSVNYKCVINHFVKANKKKAK